MIVMVGKRLAAAGILAAAMAAAAALRSATAPPPRPVGRQVSVSSSPLNSSALRAIRRVPPAVMTITLAPLRFPTTSPSSRVPVRPTVASVAASAALFALALLAVAGPRRSRAVAVPARPPRRGRAPPGSAADHRAARTCNH